MCEKEAVETLQGPELQRDQLGGYRWIEASSEYSLTQSLFPKAECLACRTVQLPKYYQSDDPNFAAVLVQLNKLLKAMHPRPVRKLTT